MEEQRLVSGELQVKGAIEVDLPEVRRLEQAASEHTRNTREKIKMWMDGCTLVAASLAAIFTFYQGWVARSALEVARLEHENAVQEHAIVVQSTRAEFACKPRLPVGITIGKATTVAVACTNVGHATARSGLNTKLETWGKMPEGDMPLADPNINDLTTAGESEASFTETAPLTLDYLNSLPNQFDNVDGRGANKPTMFYFGKVAYETLGEKHLTEFCFYLAKNEVDLGRKLMLEQDEKGPYIMFRCPKWHQSH